MFSNKMKSEFNKKKMKKKII